jgi:hypothetical protein
VAETVGHLRGQVKHPGIWSKKHGDQDPAAHNRLVKKVLVFVAMLLFTAGANPVSPATSQPRSFDLDSTKSTYPFIMRLQGTTELRGGSLVVEVRSGIVRSAIPAHLGEQGVARDVRIVFGLGEKTTQGWTTVHDTPPQLVAASLSPGETRQLGPLHFVVDGIDGVVLRDRWLTASLGVIQRLPGIRAGLLWSYACAEDSLLGATDASRARAKLMRDTYSRTC